MGYQLFSSIPPSPNVDLPDMRKTSIEKNPELNETGRMLASLALERLRQDGALVIRQREQLRRALATAGEVLDWSIIPGERSDRAAAVKKDVAALAEYGAETLEQDLAQQLKDKKAEIKALEGVTSRLRALADDDGAEYPAEIEYAHTGRDAHRRLVTKIEVLTLNDAGEASSAADSIEKKLESYAKLRDEMLEDLKHERRQIGKMREGLGKFVADSNGLVLEVLATLT